jgi:hypothetical protein
VAWDVVISGSGLRLAVSGAPSDASSPRAGNPETGALKTRRFRRRSVVRYALIAAALIVLALVVTQIVLPPLLESKVEDRLTKGGGRASVDLDAVPALRLLAHDGDRFALEGRGLELPLDQKQSVFDRLDGFDSVSVRLVDVTAGPFSVGRFELSRAGGEKSYQLVSTGSSSVARVSSYLASGLPPLLSALLAGATRGATGRAADRRIPFALDAELASDDGRPRLVSGSGSVAGIPTGPLAALLAQTVLSRL